MLLLVLFGDAIGFPSCIISSSVICILLCAFYWLFFARGEGVIVNFVLQEQQVILQNIMSQHEESCNKRNMKVLSQRINNDFHIRTRQPNKNKVNEIDTCQK